MPQNLEKMSSEKEAKLKALQLTIDKLEKTKVEINAYKRYSELFFAYAFLGLLFLFLEIVLRFTWLRKLV